MHPQRILNAVQHLLNVFRKQDVPDNTEPPTSACTIPPRTNTIKRLTSSVPRRRKAASAQPQRSIDEFRNATRRSESLGSLTQQPRSQNIHQHSFHLRNVESSPRLGFLQHSALPQLSFQQSEIINEYPTSLSWLQQSAVAAPQQLSFPQITNVEKPTLQKLVASTIQILVPPLAQSAINSDKQFNSQQLHNLKYASPCQHQNQYPDSIENSGPHLRRTTLEYAQQLQSDQHIIDDLETSVVEQHINNLEYAAALPSSSVSAPELAEPKPQLRQSTSSFIKKSNVQPGSKRIRKECTINKEIGTHTETPCSKQIYKINIKQPARYNIKRETKIPAIVENSVEKVAETRSKHLEPYYIQEHMPTAEKRKRQVTNLQKNTSGGNLKEQSVGNTTISKYRKTS